MGSFKKFSKIAAIIAAGGIASRWHGGGFKTAPKVIKNCAWALPFATVAYLAMVPLWAVVVCFTLCLLKAAPTRQYLDLGTFADKIRKRNTFDFLLIPFWGYDPRDPEIPENARVTPVELLYSRDACGLSITGLAATSGAVFAFAYIGSSSAVVAFCVAGLLKGPCYMLGRKLSFIHATELGEFLTGLAAFAAIAYTLALFNLI